MYQKKLISELVLEDFDRYSVWEITEPDMPDYHIHYTQPIKNMKKAIKSNDYFIVRVIGYLADGTQLFGIGRVSFKPPEVSFNRLFINNEQIDFYWSFYTREHEKEIIVDLLKKKIKDIFPIKIIADIPNSAFDKVIFKEYY